LGIGLHAFEQTDVLAHVVQFAVGVAQFVAESGSLLLALLLRRGYLCGLLLLPGLRRAQALQTLYDRADAYSGLVDETERVRKAFFEQWYHLGRRTLLDVLTAESDYYGNQVSEVTSRFDGYNAVFREYSGAGALVGYLRKNPEPPAP
jgi:hypothetical protein